MTNKISSFKRMEIEVIMLNIAIQFGEVAQMVRAQDS